MAQLGRRFGKQLQLSLGLLDVRNVVLGRHQQLCLRLASMRSHLLGE